MYWSRSLWSHTDHKSVETISNHIPRHSRSYLEAFERGEDQHDQRIVQATPPGLRQEQMLASDSKAYHSDMYAEDPWWYPWLPPLTFLIITLAACSLESGRQ